MKTKLSVSGFAAVLGCLSVTAYAAPSVNGLRLIQTSALARAWLSDADITALSIQAHEDGHCGGFMDVTDHQIKKPLYLRPLTLDVKRVPTQPEAVNRLLPELGADRLLEGVAKLSSFRNRYYQSDTGVASAAWIRDQFLALAHGRTDITVREVTHRFKMPSVIARIEGTTKAAETVILGAHADSINWSFGSPNPNALAPGADDDASGTSTLLEVFRVLAQSGHRPVRSIEFMAYAGEERGLLGSQDIAEQYKQAGRLVAGVLQLDMTMYPGAGHEITFISDYVDHNLTAFMKLLVDQYVRVPWRENECGYACSDHASWTEEGYPAVFPFEAPMKQHNPKIHTTEDTTDLLNAGFGLHFAKLALAFAVELGAGD